MVSQETNRSNYVSFRDLVLNILDYSYLIPINIYFTVDSSIIILRFYIERKNKATDGNFKINNPESVSNLDNIDYVIFDKTGTLTEKKFILNSIVLKEKTFVVDHLFTEEDPISPFVQKQIELKNEEQKNEPSNLLSRSKQYQSVVSLDESNDQNPQDIPFIPEPSGFSPGRVLGKNKSIPLENEGKTKFKKKYSTPVEITKKASEEANVFNFEFDNDFQDSPLQRASAKGLKNDFEKLLGHGNTDRDVREFFKCLSLTHPKGLMINQNKMNGRRRESFLNEEDLKQEIYDYEENLLINFCNYYGFGFSSCRFGSKSLNVPPFMESSSITYILKDAINNKEYKYNVLGINEFSYSRKRFSIFLQDIKNDRSILYCKGNYDAMGERLKLNPDQKNSYELLIKKLANKGLRVLVFGKKLLGQEESLKFFNRYNDLKKSVVSQKRELEKLAITMECELELVGVVGIKEKLRSDAEKTVKEFQSSNSRIWILSGDTYINTFNAGVNVNLYNSTAENDVIHFKETNGDNLRYFMRDILSDMKNYEEAPREINLDESNPEKEKEMERINSNGDKSSLKEKKFSKLAKKYFEEKLVVVNGDSLAVILKDPFLKLNFIFIMALAQKLIGYNFTPDQKSEFVKIIKEKFLHSPTVLAVGDGHNDALMLRTADVSIEICDDIKDSSNIGDIRIGSLKTINNLIRVYGRNNSKMISFLIRLRFFQSFYYVFCLFLSNCLFHGKLFAYSELVLYYVVLQTMDFLIICILNLEGTQNLKDDMFFPHKLQKSYKFSFFFFLWLFFYGGISALVTYLVMWGFIDNYYEYNANSNKDIQRLDAFRINALMFLVIAIVNQEHIFIFYFRNNIKKLKIFLHLGLFILMLFIFCWINTHNDMKFNQDLSVFIFTNLWLVILPAFAILTIKFLCLFLFDSLWKNFKPFVYKLIGNTSVNLKFEKGDGV